MLLYQVTDAPIESFSYKQFVWDAWEGEMMLNAKRCAAFGKAILTCWLSVLAGKTVGEVTAT